MDQRYPPQVRTDRLLNKVVSIRWWAHKLGATPLQRIGTDELQYSSRYTFVWYLVFSPFKRLLSPEAFDRMRPRSLSSVLVLVADQLKGLDIFGSLGLGRLRSNRQA